MVTAKNLHEFGPQGTTCALDPIHDEDNNPITDEGGNNLCPETDVPTIPFKMVVTMTAFDSFTLGHHANDNGLSGDPLVYDYVVQWGDGESDHITEYDQAETTHTYTDADNYTITIDGACPNFRYGVSGPGSGSRSEITEISAWGKTGFKYMNGAFGYCSNLKITATDIPDFSACTDIRWMFKECVSLTTGAEGWDFSNGLFTSIRYLFDHCDSFDCDLSGWNLTGITDMQGVLNYCQQFDNDISGWDTSAVTDMAYLFFFNAQLRHLSVANLDTSVCTNFRSMLAFCTAFNVDISGWTIPTLSGDVSMQQMFNSSDNFNQNIDAWDVSAVTNMSEMFQDAFDFNQDFLTWDTGSVTDMSYMFNASFGTSWGSFNGDVSNFDTSSVLTMRKMFNNCNEFNQNVGSWIVTNVTNMELMFANNYIFNQNLNSWNVSKVIDFRQMFANCSAFNGNVTSWTPVAAIDMDNMFSSCSNFNQDISGWDITGTTTLDNILFGANSFSTANYDLLLNAWSLLTVVASQAMTFTPSYTIATSQAARDILTTAPNNWSITDGGGI